MHQKFCLYAVLENQKFQNSVFTTVIIDLRLISLHWQKCLCRANKSSLTKMFVQLFQPSVKECVWFSSYSSSTSENGLFPRFSSYSVFQPCLKTQSPTNIILTLKNIRKQILICRAKATLDDFKKLIRKK